MSPLWNLIGAGRALGTWECGRDDELDAAVDGVVESGNMTKQRFEAALLEAFSSFLTRHERYHSETGMSGAPERLGKGGVEDHGPGFVDLLTDASRQLEEIPAPPGHARAVGSILHFFRRGRDFYARGVELGRGKGEALFEIGFTFEWQFAGAPASRG